MTDVIPSSVFTHDDVRLRIWFNDGSGSEHLTPHQVIELVGYASHHTLRLGLHRIISQLAVYTRTATFARKGRGRI